MNINELKFDDKGLIPAIVVDATSKKVLTLAYMNRESLEISMKEGRTCFYSRSRKELWRKGETSGNVQHIVSITADCDADALIVMVDKEGPACHLGTDSCFNTEVFHAEPEGRESNHSDTNRDIDDNKAESLSEISCVPGDDTQNSSFSVRGLYELLQERQAHPKEGSYTTYLFEKGLDKILKKVGEESTEVIIAGHARDKAETIYEIADLTYHVMALMVNNGITVDDIISELASRHVIDHKVKQEKMTKS